MTNGLRWCAVLAIAICAAAVVAAKVKVQTQYDKKFNFAGLHTYAWHPTGKGDVKLLQASGENPAALRERLEPMVVRAVDGALAKRGFTAASASPDLNVYYYVLIGPGISAQTRAAFVYGAGADFNITHRFFARAQYRGLVYNSPTFDLAPVAGLDRMTHRAEPSIGFGYRF